MEINQVRFGNYSIGNPAAKQTKHGSKSENDVPQVRGENKTELNPDEMFSAMNIAGLHNKAQINFVSEKEINPADFLSEERIADIEAMMERFDSGVNSVAEIVGNELPGISEQNKNALAAEIFARE